MILLALESGSPQFCLRVTGTPNSKSCTSEMKNGTTGHGITLLPFSIQTDFLRKFDVGG